MTAITQSRLGRLFRTEPQKYKVWDNKKKKHIEYTKWITIRKVPIDAPKERERIEYDFQGVHFSVLMSHGQIISKYRYLKKEMKRRSEEWAQKRRS